MKLCLTKSCKLKLFFLHLLPLPYHYLAANSTQYVHNSLNKQPTVCDLKPSTINDSNGAPDHPQDVCFRIFFLRQKCTCFDNHLTLGRTVHWLVALFFECRLLKVGS